jgi:hypothetical protein
MSEYTTRRIALEQLEATPQVKQVIALLHRAEAGEVITPEDWEAASTLSHLPVSEEIALDNSEYIAHWSTLWAVAWATEHTPDATAQVILWAGVPEGNAARIQAALKEAA